MDFSASLLVSVILVVLASGSRSTVVVSSCSIDEDCWDLADSVCSDSKCVCPDQFFANDDYTRCLPPALDPSSPCETASQCASRLGLGIVCTEAACACGEGYHYLHGTCRKSVALGEPCEQSDDCFDNHATHTLTCSGGVCACAEGAYLRHDVCRLKARGEGDACDFREDCTKTDPSLFCVDNVCVSGDSTTPAPSDPAETYHSDNTQLYDMDPLSLMLVNTTCNSTDQCDANEMCSVLNTCVCETGYYRHGDGSCMLELGELCSEDADCAHISDARCGETDTARGKTCHCGPRWAPDPTNTFCRLARKMNYSCAVDANCFAFGIGGLCQDYKCACAEGYRYVEEEYYCWPIKALGEACTSDLDCYYDGSTCSEGACGCGSGYHNTSTGVCLKDVIALGDACVENSDCSPMNANSVCTEGKCSCADTYVQSGATSCDVGIGGDCSMNETCSKVEGAYCDIENEMCSCEADFIASESGNVCLKVAFAVGEECSELKQCQTLMGFNATCNTNTSTCECVSGTHFADGACWTSTVLGEPCSRVSECFAPLSRDGLECRNGVCECQFDYVQAEDGSACQSGAASWLRLSTPTSTLFLLGLAVLRSAV